MTQLNVPGLPFAQPQIQSDWNESDNTRPDYVKNKPSIPSTAGLVPYSGANANVDLGTHTLSAACVNTPCVTATGGASLQLCSSGIGQMCHSLGNYVRVGQGTSVIGSCNSPTYGRSLVSANSQGQAVVQGGVPLGSGGGQMCAMPNGSVLFTNTCMISTGGYPSGLLGGSGDTAYWQFNDLTGGVIATDNAGGACLEGVLGNYVCTDGAGHSTMAGSGGGCVYADDLGHAHMCSVAGSCLYVDDVGDVVGVATNVGAVYFQDGPGSFVELDGQGSAFVQTGGAVCTRSVLCNSCGNSSVVADGAGNVCIQGNGGVNITPAGAINISGYCVNVSSGGSNAICVNDSCGGIFCAQNGSVTVQDVTGSCLQLSCNINLCSNSGGVSIGAACGASASLNSCGGSVSAGGDGSVNLMPTTGANINVTGPLYHNGAYLDLGVASSNNFSLNEAGGSSVVGGGGGLTMSGSNPYVNIQLDNASNATINGQCGSYVQIDANGNINIDGQPGGPGCVNICGILYINGTPYSGGGGAGNCITDGTGCVCVDVGNVIINPNCGNVILTSDQSAGCYNCAGVTTMIGGFCAICVVNGLIVGVS